MLRAKLPALPHVGALNLFNAKGWLINSSEMWPVPDIEHCRPALFQGVHARASRRPSVIVEPVVSKVTGKLDHDLRAQDHRPQRRDHRLCQPRRRALAFRGFRRVAGAEQRHRDLDDPSRRHHHRPLSQGRQAGRPERRRHAAVSAGAGAGRQRLRALHEPSRGRGQGRRGPVADALSDPDRRDHRDRDCARRLAGADQAAILCGGAGDRRRHRHDLPDRAPVAAPASPPRSTSCRRRASISTPPSTT